MTDDYETCIASLSLNSWTQPMTLVLYRPLVWNRWRNP